MVEIAEFQCLRRVYDKWVSIIRAEAKEIMVYGRFSRFTFFTRHYIIQFLWSKTQMGNRWYNGGFGRCRELEMVKLESFF